MDWQKQFQAIPTEADFDRPGFTWAGEECIAGAWLEVSHIEVSLVASGGATLVVRGYVAEFTTTGRGIPTSGGFVARDVPVRPDDDDLREVLRDELRYDGHPLGDVARHPHATLEVRDAVPV